MELIGAPRQCITSIDDWPAQMFQTVHVLVYTSAGSFPSGVSLIRFAYDDFSDGTNTPAISSYTVAITRGATAFSLAISFSGDAALLWKISRNLVWKQHQEPFGNPTQRDALLAWFRSLRFNSDIIKIKKRRRDILSVKAEEEEEDHLKFNRNAFLFFMLECFRITCTSLEMIMRPQNRVTHSAFFHFRFICRCSPTMA